MHALLSTETGYIVILCGGELLLVPHKVSYSNDHADVTDESEDSCGYTGSDIVVGKRR